LFRRKRPKPQARTRRFPKTNSSRKDPKPQRGWIARLGRFLKQGLSWRHGATEKIRCGNGSPLARRRRR
jgi:hypothetical protein